MHHGLFCDGPKKHSPQNEATLHLLPLSTVTATNTLDLWRIANRNPLRLLEVNDDY